MTKKEKKQNNMLKQEDRRVKRGYIANSIHKLNKMMTKKQRFKLITYIDRNRPNANDWQYNNVNLCNIYFTMKQQKNNVLKRLYLKKYN